MIRKARSLRAYFLIPCVGFIFLADRAYASFSLPPRLSASAYASDYTVGQADLMLPVRGNTTQNFYVDPALSYDSDNQSELDIGLGYRWINNDAAILGGYIFGGYSRIANNARLWVANPGIEALGSRWDAHLNAYFPMGDRHYVTGTEIVPFFIGHSEFGRIFLINQYVGNGADAKVGYQLFPGSSWKAYLGSYYFSPAETNNVWGGAAGLEYWLTQNVKLVGSYTYDNLRRSTYAFGIGLEWGGTRVNRADPALEERITDPVERYLAELGRGSKMPSPLKLKPRRRIIRTGATGDDDIVGLGNDIVFFSLAGRPNNNGTGLTLANCTFENPCGPTDFTQTAVSTFGTLLPNTLFYFNGGTYSAGAVSLVPGQSVESRSAGYTQPATGAARSTIITDRIGLNGNNSLVNIILSGATNNNGKVQVQGLNNVITGSQIGTPGFTQLIGVRNTSGGLLINNTVVSNSSVTGLFLDGGNTSVQNSEINILGNTPIGINALGGARVTLNNVQIFGTGTSVTPADATIGIFVQGPATTNVNATNTTISLTAPTSEANGLVTLGATAGSIQYSGGAITLTALTTRPTQTIGGSIATPDTVCISNGSVVTC